MSLFRPAPAPAPAVQACLIDPHRRQVVADVASFPPDKRLAQITKMAAAAMRTPLCLVTLLNEERQLFLAVYDRCDLLAQIRSTPVEESYCQFVVATGEVLAIPNATKHPWVRHLRAAKVFRSYLGVPIMREDVTLGSLCVLDTEPRKWREEDEAVLREFAKLTEMVIGEEP